MTHNRPTVKICIWHSIAVENRFSLYLGDPDPSTGISK
jgi:hypothetical protein